MNEKNQETLQRMAAKLSIAPEELERPLLSESERLIEAVPGGLTGKTAVMTAFNMNPAYQARVMQSLTEIQRIITLARHTLETKHAMLSDILIAVRRLTNSQLKWPPGPKRSELINETGYFTSDGAVVLNKANRKEIKSVEETKTP